MTPVSALARSAAILSSATRFCAGDDIARVTGVEKDHGLAAFRQAAKGVTQVGIAPISDA